MSFISVLKIPKLTKLFGASGSNNSVKIFEALWFVKIKYVPCFTVISSLTRELLRTVNSFFRTFQNYRYNLLF